MRFYSALWSRKLVEWFLSEFSDLEIFCFWKLFLTATTSYVRNKEKCFVEPNFWTLKLSDQPCALIFREEDDRDMLLSCLGCTKLVSRCILSEHWSAGDNFDHWLDLNWVEFNRDKWVVLWLYYATLCECEYITGHPVQKKRTNSKRNFTEKIMPESKSLGKRYMEKRCHLMGCNDSSGKLGRWPM